jgi:hypothetical protein
MNFIDDLPGFLAASAVRVLDGRAAILRGLTSMLAAHDVPFTFDEDRFRRDRLYAACTLHAQRRVVGVLERATRGEVGLAEVRAQAAALVGRQGGVALLLLDRDRLDSLLAGEHVVPDAAAAAALPWLEQTDLRAYVESGASLALLGRRITQDQGVRNHSDEFHLFTVHVDVVRDNPVKTAEALVHEASHNVLNVFLEDRQITLRDTPAEWYSPWTNSLRHHRGIVHGFFAFTLVVAFYQRLDVPEFQAEIDRYSAMQAQHLRVVYPSLQVILSQYPNELRALIEETHGCVV